MEPLERPSPLSGILRGGTGTVRPISLEDLAGDGDFIALPTSRGGDPKRRKIEELQGRVDSLQSELVRVRAKADSDLAAGREEAYQKGLKDGSAAGEAAGKAIAEAQAERRLQEIESSVRSRLDALDRSLDQIFLDWESRIVELSMAIARRIVGEACLVPGEAAVHVSRMALRKLGAEARVVVRCHPQDLTAMEREKDLWGSRTGRRISLEPDQSVGRGGVVVETDTGTIDARIPRLAENVEKVLASALEEEKARGDLPA
jgi:flagellar biosynthesis/type III secretory pathway protein FliH